MKKILVIGAGGSIGINVIKFLLTSGKYEITALDLNNKRVSKRLKKYRKRINIEYGDINDYFLVEKIVKDKDAIIDLATVMPPLGDYSYDVGEFVEYKGVENLIKAINYFNDKCFFIYASTTSMYGNIASASTKEKIKTSKLSNYNKNKYNTELLIKKKLKHYTILRVPLVLNGIKDEPFMFNVNKNSIVEVTTNVDAAYAFTLAVDKEKELNKKIFNIGMGKEGILCYNDILKNILKYRGISLRYILSRLFLEKNYYSPVLTDSDKLNDILKYRTDTLNNYYSRLKRSGKNRRIRKLLAKPIILLKK